MRRVAVTLVATVVGLVLLLQFKIHSTQPTTGGLAALNSTSGSRPSPTSRHRSGRPASAVPTPSPRRRHHVTAPKARTITGQTIQTRYGPIQVQIVEVGSRLSDVKALQLPNSDAHSAEIAANAVPILRSEALRANSARIDVVSGATYTSNGYAQSLQSALDNA